MRGRRGSHRTAGTPTLQPPSYLDTALAHRAAFIVREGDETNRAKLTARGLRLLAEGAHFAVYAKP